MPLTIGIRGEDKNEWERRAPLTPDHVRELRATGEIDFVVEPSARRAFEAEAYREAGARIETDLGACDLVLGVKEIPPDRILANRPHLFFSHVVKRQEHNRPLLRALLDRGATLVDYERIVDARGRRLIFFGRHAGHAGMIDTLWALGQRLAAEGATTPLERLRPAHRYASLEQALAGIAAVGEEIRRGGLGATMRPVVFGFTGSGNVTHGALEVFDRLPTAELSPEEVEELSEDRSRLRNVFYRCVFERAHRMRRRSDGGFDAAESTARPELYESAFEPYLRHLTGLVHGAYWEAPQPPLVSRAMLERLFSGDDPPKLRVIGDISCDIEGGIEATVRATTSGDPVYVFDPESGAATSGVAGRGVVIMAVDNLPCELPREASQHFGDSLARFVGALARCDWSRPFETIDLPPAIRRAVVCHRGLLTPEFRYLAEWVGEVA